MDLRDRHIQRGAILAPDGIPLHFGDTRSEYRAAMEAAVLMDRSHEGRLECRGRDRLDLIHRISTNDVLGLKPNQGCATILTTPIGRIIDRLLVYHNGNAALVTTEPGRGPAAMKSLQRQIFFKDDFTVRDLSSETQLFTLHGPRASEMVMEITGGNSWDESLALFSVNIETSTVTLLRRKNMIGGHWAVIMPVAEAITVWSALTSLGQSYGLLETGSLTYNAIRIRSGRPAAGRELTGDYIPLEAGLWDEVSFTKGCYTGQEIIARMESRNRLARTLVKLQLPEMIDAPAELFHAGRLAGTLTSSVTTPDSERIGLGFVKLDLATPGATVQTSAGQPVTVVALAGAQPPNIHNETH